MTKTDILKSELSKKGLKYVGTRGNVGSPVCFVGEAPGADEDQQGVPFVGSSGRELDRMSTEAGIDLSNAWWTNPYKTRPPDNKLARLCEYGILESTYTDQFFEELNNFKPNIIIPLGATPLGLLCPFTKSYKKPFNAQISKYIGSLLTSPLLQWEHYVIPSYHPAYILRQYSDRPIAILCLAKAEEEFQYWRSCSKLQPLPERQLLSDASFAEAKDFLTSLLALPTKQAISIDIENIGVYRGKYRTPQRNRLPYCLAFAPSPWLAMSIELGAYDVNQTRIIWSLIDQILRERRQIGQNYYTHDAPWLRYIGFSPNIRLLQDTIVRHHVLWPELSHKLEFQTMQYTREPYYKDEGKNFSVKEKTKFKRYNCKDVCVTYEIFDRQEEEFKERSSAQSS